MKLGMIGLGGWREYGDGGKRSAGMFSAHGAPPRRPRCLPSQEVTDALDIDDGHRVHRQLFLGSLSFTGLGISLFQQFLKCCS
jgi:hypothetical protein